MAAFGLVAAALGVPSLLIGPDAIGDAVDRAKARSDLRTAAVQSLGVLAVLLAGWYTARTYRLGREGQLTERFKAGVEMLAGGDVNTTGGMLALERVARDSPRDHPIVMELLASYARSHATSEEALRTVLLVIGRRDLRYDSTRPLAINLTHLEAEGMTLIDLNLEGADLSASNFKTSLLSGLKAAQARLERAQLEGADLQDARFDDASLMRANLRFAVLANAVMRRAQLSGANLMGAMLLNADLGEANLSGATLTDAQLHGARFAKANLDDAVLQRCSSSLQRTPPDFRAATLRGAQAQAAVLPAADFRGADLTGANFDDAVLDRADFRGAQLAGASFRNAHLRDSRRDDATGAADTAGAVGADEW